MRNAAVGWTVFDLHTTVGKPGKGVLVEVLTKARPPAEVEGGVGNLRIAL